MNFYIVSACDVWKRTSDVVEVAELCSIDCSCDEVITKQSFASECDINVIMSRYEKTGTVDFLNKHEPMYGECTAVDLQEALDTVMLAENMFSDMPAKLRAEFNNDPVLFLKSVDDPSQRGRLEELGLISKPIPADYKPPAGDNSA